MDSTFTIKSAGGLLLLLLCGGLYGQHIEIQPATAGNLKLQTAGGHNAIQVLSGGGIKLQAHTGNATTIMGADGSEGVYISQDGNIGIGSISPITKFQIGNYQHFFLKILVLQSIMLFLVIIYISVLQILNIQIMVLERQ